ncbi:hypothetical protein ACH9DO_15730 [Kocuria sp. M1N1S27]|uniref:hypothetical protein n=1 Tax=Kocuria kalidii TaxID=3376283 RepID=UPI0037BB87E2
MTTSAPPSDLPASEDGEAIAPATVVDLTTGSAHITPVLVDGEARYAVDLPDQPLDEGDVASLAVALQVAQSGPAVLVDIEEYSEAELSPEDGTGHQP